MDKKLIPVFREMYWDLIGNKFEWAFVPHPDYQKDQDGCRKRECRVPNPEWYRDLLRKYPSGRKKSRNYQNPKKVGCDSKIKRRNLESVLERLSEGKTSTSKYVSDLEEIAQKMLKEGSYLKTEVEQYFWFRFQIGLSEKFVEVLNNFPEELWEEIGYFYRNNGCFPEYLYLDSTPPF